MRCARIHSYTNSTHCKARHAHTTKYKRNTCITKLLLSVKARCWSIWLLLGFYLFSPFSLSSSWPLFPPVAAITLASRYTHTGTERMRIAEANKRARALYEAHNRKTDRSAGRPGNGAERGYRSERRARTNYRKRVERKKNWLTLGSHQLVTYPVSWISCTAAWFASSPIFPLSRTLLYAQIATIVGFLLFPLCSFSCVSVIRVASYIIRSCWHRVSECGGECKSEQ